MALGFVRFWGESASLQPPQLMRAVGRFMAQPEKAFDESS